MIPTFDDNDIDQKKALLMMLKGVISDMTPEQQEKIKGYQGQIQAIIDAGGDIATIALSKTLMESGLKGKG